MTEEEMIAEIERLQGVIDSLVASHNQQKNIVEAGLARARNDMQTFQDELDKMIASIRELEGE